MTPHKKVSFDEIENSVKKEKDINALSEIYLTTQNSRGEISIPLCTENIYRALQHHDLFKNTLRYDEFLYRHQILKNNEWKTLTDSDVITIQTKISELLPMFLKVGKDMTYDAIIKACRNNPYDSAIDYVTSITWDNVPRLDTWLCETYGVENNTYHRAVGSNWWKGMVKRILYPGCKFDFVLVLEGEQGSKKSTSLSIIGGGWHTETVQAPDNKDFFMMFAGKTIIEFSEGETLSRTEIKKMKAVITMQVDTYRPPYERSVQDYPRRCVFAMTTNQEQYLKDETGNRRWLPVRVVFPEANIEWLKQNRDQLYAEAVHRVKTLNETVWEMPLEETLEQQNARQVSDPNEDRIVDWYTTLPQSDKDNGVTVYQVYDIVFNAQYGKKTMTKYEEMSISTVLKNTLNLERKRLSVDGKRSWKWYEKDHEHIKEEVSIEAVYNSF